MYISLFHYGNFLVAIFVLSLFLNSVVPLLVLYNRKTHKGIFCWKLDFIMIYLKSLYSEC